MCTYLHVHYVIYVHVYMMLHLHLHISTCVHRMLPHSNTCTHIYTGAPTQQYIYMHTDVCTYTNI